MRFLGFQDLVLQKLVIIDRDLKELLRRTSGSLAQGDNKVVDFDLPVDGLEGLAKLKEWLSVEENFKRLVKAL